MNTYSWLWTLLGGAVTFAVLRLLRSAKARTVEVLEQAVGEALHAVTPADTAGCFAGCGYGLR